jgi:hypothetical protein
MIPEFPQFKKLELADKGDIEKFTLKYPPYSDFNFAGTLSWDVRDKMQISQLHGNYVIRFINYLTGVPFYTFLGENNINETVQELLDLAKQENLEVKLAIMPEESVKGIDLDMFSIEEDRDNFDYIYDIAELKDFEGKKFSKKRKDVSAFLRKYPDVETKILDLTEKKVEKDLLLLLRKWAENKLKKNPDFDLYEKEEMIVIKKLFLAIKELDLVGVGIFIENNLVAFCINELVGSEYAVAHVGKADLTTQYAFSFLMKKNAEVLYSHNRRFFNTEQDLGVENLRQAKMRFRPSFFLKKYIITYK